MTKRSDPSGHQLSLELAVTSRVLDRSQADVQVTQNVAYFVDAATRAVRQEAISRVERSGIFQRYQGPTTKA